MVKAIGEINEKIKEGKAVVVTAEEIIDFAKQKGKKSLSGQRLSLLAVGVSALPRLSTWQQPVRSKK